MDFHLTDLLALRVAARRVQVAITDPVTLDPYGYETGEGTAYELCAVFELATATAERELRSPSIASVCLSPKNSSGVTHVDGMASGTLYGRSSRPSRSSLRAPARMPCRP